MNELDELLDERGGIVGVNDLAELFEVNPSVVREWASENGIPRAGNAYAFRLEDARELEADLTADEDESDDEDAESAADEDDDDAADEGDGDDDEAEEDDDDETDDEDDGDED